MSTNAILADILHRNLRSENGCKRLFMILGRDFPCYQIVMNNRRVTNE